MRKPVIVIPMGDPCGVGPEITVKALLSERVAKAAQPFVVGDEGVLKHYINLLGLDVKIKHVSTPNEGLYQKGIINLLSLNNADSFSIGEVQASAGLAAYEYIKKAVDITLSGDADAIATAPINKESLSAARIGLIGHTEILAHLTDANDPLTMFETKSLRIFFLSRHVSLSEAIKLCTKDRLTNYILRCSRSLEQLGVKTGTLAVAGLNPHCGEHGLFGNEEVAEIEPAVFAARELGCDVAGPIGADSVFAQALKGKYSAVLSLYHDQGHIAAKTLDFERTISITLSLPLLRTSVDHGTAFDIAGKGIANESGMIEAIVKAAKYAPKFNKNKNKRG